MTADKQHDPQPVRVTRYPLVDDVAAELGITADEVLAKLPPYEFVGHNPGGLRISPAGAAEVRAAVTGGARPVPCRDRGDGVCVSCGQRVGGPCARPTFVHGDDGFLRDVDPPPPGLAARSLAAMDPEGDAVQHQGGEDAEIRDCVIQVPTGWTAEEAARWSAGVQTFSDALRAMGRQRLMAETSAGATAAHLTVRRAIEDMAAAHREQLAGARAATRKAADEAERWRVEAEAARAQVGTLTAERDRYRRVLEYIVRDEATMAGHFAADVAHDWRERAREALGPAREETT